VDDSQQPVQPGQSRASQADDGHHDDGDDDGNNDARVCNDNTQE
jgi:hypothetical protein